MSGSANLIVEKTKQKKRHLDVLFLLNEECPKLICGLGIEHRRRNTI